jgi:PTS system galactitol-specific IIA component
MPTGLPFEGGAVALPHAEPEHVVSPRIAVASLARPVKFRQMGEPATQLDVTLVVMPALTAKEQAAASLTRLIELLQDGTLRRDLIAATTPEAMSTLMSAAMRQRWTDE